MTKASKRKIFPFLSLPAELRNQIYELALVNPQGHYLVAKHRNRMRTVRTATHGTSTYTGAYNPYERLRATDAEPPPQLADGLFAVNRQINEEACTLVYPKPFVFENSVALHTFLVAIGAKNRGMLTEIGLLEWGGRRQARNMLFPAFSMLSMGCDNISRFHYSPSYWQMQRPDEFATDFYKEAHPWLRALVTSKGSKDAAVDVVEFNDRDDRLGDSDLASYSYIGGYNAPDGNEGMDKFKEALKRRLR